MQKRVMIWMLMYTDWIVRQLTSGEERFLIPKEMYQKIHENEREIMEVLYSLPEVKATSVEEAGIRVFL